MATTTMASTTVQPAAEPKRLSKAVEFKMLENNLIANVSHELRIPLTNLKLRLYLARMQPENVEEHLRIMEAVTDRMRLLIEDLLDSTRLEMGIMPLKKQRVSLQSLISSVIDLQILDADRKHIALHAELPAEAVFSLVDPDRMIQVLTNLLGNAINYTPKGGKVTVQLAREGGQIAIRIRDTGVGISGELQAKIFEPFFRVEGNAAKGTGLGLAISKEIVEAHRGTISVESKAGQGSVFCIKLPSEADERPH